MIIINVARSRRPPSRPFILPTQRAVRALPAVPLICRFVCAFKHESPRRGSGERRDEERAGKRGGGNEAGGEKIRRERNEMILAMRGKMAQVPRQRSHLRSGHPRK